MKRILKWKWKDFETWYLQPTEILFIWRFAFCIMH